MIIRRTYSVCPVCLKRVPAVIDENGSECRLEKSCPEHGSFSVPVWRGEPGFAEWNGDTPEIAAGENPNCPHGCGICKDHKQGTCCVLLEVTSRCNLTCRHCFAGSSAAASIKDPAPGTVKGWIDDIARAGRVFLQLSGGEPTVRDDLPLIVEHAVKAGCAYVQLNSNGLRLAEDESYIANLAKAGLSFVFLQFDGLDDDIYATLRGGRLLARKLKAIENCGRHNIGVTLVPTLVPGVNTGEVGEIVKFAAERTPYVRGVHFQPVSYFGRYPKPPADDARITLPEVLAAVYEQAGGLVPEGSIAVSHCDHPRCGFHGAYISLGSKLVPVTQPQKGCCEVTTAEKNRHYVGSRWSMAQEPCCCSDAPGVTDAPKTQGSTSIAASPAAQLPMGRKHGEDSLKTLDGFLHMAKTHSFTISAMAFQDAYNIDLERLRRCSLHVYSNGVLKPFCSHYLSGAEPLRLP